MFQRFLSRGVLTALTVSLFLSSGARADVTGAGFGTDAVNVLSTNPFIPASDTLPNGNRIVYDGATIWIEDDVGTFLQFLGNPTPQGTYPSFVEIDPTNTFALVGENSNGGIYRVSVANGGPTLVGTIPFNYDLEYESATTVLVSAATCTPQFVCTNGIYRLDITTGATTLLVMIDGYSGPVSRSSQGDVYVGLVPSSLASGAFSVLKWSASQVANGPLPLTQAQASVFTGNLDGIAEMSFDPAYGELFVAGKVGGVEGIYEVDRGGTLVGSVATTTASAGKIEVRDVPGEGVCAAFQPAGSSLRYRTTDYMTATSYLTDVSPRRPVLASVQNGNGTMTCMMTGGQPNSPCLVISGNVSVYSGTESVHDLSSYLLWTGIPFNMIRRAGLGFMTDAAGSGSFTFNNPAGIHGTRVLQVLVRDAHGVFRGSSTPAFN
jgi:hypothetical protein